VAKIMKNGLLKFNTFLLVYAVFFGRDKKQILPKKVSINANI